MVNTLLPILTGLDFALCTAPFWTVHLRLERWFAGAWRGRGGSTATAGGMAGAALRAARQEIRNAACRCYLGAFTNMAPAAAAPSRTAPYATDALSGCASLTVAQTGNIGRVRDV